MLLESNTEKGLELLDRFDSLSDVDKIRLANIISMNPYITINFNVDEIKKVLKEVLGELDPESKNTIINFSLYKGLLVLSAKYMELSVDEKEHFYIEMLFNIFETDFNRKIKEYINKNLNVYDYCYFILNN